MNKLKQNFSLLLLLIFQSVAVGLYAQDVATLTAETALESYLEKAEPAYSWEVKETFQTKSFTMHELLMTSQTWRDIEWTHQLSLIVPNHLASEEALLFITGGSNSEGQPRWKNNREDDLLLSLGKIAADNKAVVALLRQTPNQPLYGSMTEDELISFTLHNFLKDKDYEWPLLFPMVKSAVKAMDAIEEFGDKDLGKNIDKFVVSGASKRGWTTWLTGANDSRVIGIAPMVIDILNMPKSLDYQIETWGDYSVQIQNYVKLGIPQSTNTPGGQEITTMIDPYSYLPKLTMPKLLVMGTNDEYWVVDNVKNYLDDLEGTTLLQYVPNAGHSLGDKKQAFRALDAFFENTLNRESYPHPYWEISEWEDKIELDFQVSEDLKGVDIWTTTSQDRDVRKAKWIKKELDIKEVDSFLIEEPYPDAGYKAFYVDLKYSTPSGKEYTVSSRVFLMDAEGLL